MRDIRPIRNEADYEWALDELTRYFDDLPEAGSEEADRFDVLATLVERYEDRHWPVEMADPVEVIETVMQAQGRSQADLGRLLGSRSRASEILNRRRSLTLAAIRRLHDEWHVPAAALLKPYRLRLAG